MRVTFFGVRGSIPTPDEPQFRYGGNTACVEARLPDGSSVSFDAGTGLRWLATSRMEKTGPKGHNVDILLSHYHWDHIQGLPFTPLMYIPGNTIRVFGMSSGPGLRESLLGQLRPDFCPVPNFILPNVGAEVSLHELHEEASYDLGSALLKWRRLPRGGASTVTGYRLESEGKAVAYLTDVDYTGPPEEHEGALELARGADLIIHDAQYLPDEQPVRKHGHSNYQRALELARAARCPRLALIHHDPGRTDDELDRLAEVLKTVTDLHAFPASEGMTVEL